MSKPSSERITRVCEILYGAARRTRILSHLGWHGSVREQFFQSGAKELPVVNYPAYDAAPILEQIDQARSLLQGSSIDRWLERQADALHNSAQLLLNTGKPEFFEYSRRLYGAPDDVLIDGKSTSLTLAKTFDQTLNSLSGFDQTFLPEQDVSSDELAAVMEKAVADLFGSDAPKVLVVDELSANALAGSERIRIRRAAQFNDKDIAQLIHHEAGIHVATSLNGKHQKQLPILAPVTPAQHEPRKGSRCFQSLLQALWILNVYDGCRIEPLPSRWQPTAQTFFRSIIFF